MSWARFTRGFSRLNCECRNRRSLAFDLLGSDSHSDWSNRAMAESGGKGLSDKKKLELVEKSVHHLDLFVSSFRWLHGTATTDEDKEEQRRSIKESEESGVLEWFLSAQFLKARLLGKIETVPFQRSSCEMYRWLVEFAEHRLPAGSESFRAEFSVAKQMLELLPTKIERM
jgi:hypothetical protein